jgi:hypothetical protein
VTGGSAGNQVTRCAFACMVKIHQLTKNLQIILDQFEMSYDMLTLDKEEIINELQTDGFDDICTRWQSACRMKIWLKERQRDISNLIKQEAIQNAKEQHEEYISDIIEFDENLTSPANISK